MQKDLLELFDYVEPSDTNEPCYSYRIRELLMRACIEVEANCTAILSENGYVRLGDWNMTDYRKLETTHHLSSYEVRLPTWFGAHTTRRPFAQWQGAAGAGLSWYQAYNRTKHSRHDNFQDANFGALVDAVCGLAAILASQFMNEDFGPDYIVTSAGPGDGFEYGTGGYFLIKAPDDWPPAERYDFNWGQLRADPAPITTLTF